MTGKYQLSSDCVVDFSNRHIVHAGKQANIRKQCWIILEALVEAKLQNSILRYEQMDKLLWADDVGLDDSKKQAIQDCIRDLRRAIGNGSIKNQRSFGYCLSCAPTAVVSKHSAVFLSLDEEFAKVREHEKRIYQEISTLHPSNQTIYDLQGKMNDLIARMEYTKEKLTSAIQENDQFWVPIYEQQLALHLGAQQELFSLFRDTEEQLGRYEHIIMRLKSIEDILRCTASDITSYRATEPDDRTSVGGFRGHSSTYDPIVTDMIIDMDRWLYDSFCKLDAVLTSITATNEEIAIMDRKMQNLFIGEN